MPCNKVGAKHSHIWPTQAEGGELVIERCEVLCGYCEGADAEHNWKFAWCVSSNTLMHRIVRQSLTATNRFLRRHVATVHCKPGASYDRVKVQEKW